MLFNSYPFFCFFFVLLAGLLPLLLLRQRTLAFCWLIGASLFFYGKWEIWHLPLLLGSVLFNYLFGKAIEQQLYGYKKLWVILSVTANLLFLAYFKYLGFFAASAGFEVLSDNSLPLGISFFTFQQIAYLVDIYRGKVQIGAFIKYLLFVSFFPQLVAGPIVHYKQVIPQFERPQWLRFNPELATLGLGIFSVGLFKKTVLADSFAKIADPVFGMAAAGKAIESLTAWKGLFAYSFQIYFDFSAYAEMAIGLGLIVGIWLPVNFFSPYKAESITVFWRRWHITLSHFLRDYLYFPLGGNRLGKRRQMFNLFITMLLAGLWHGAGWHFIAWGAAHGLFLGIAHLYGSHPLVSPIFKWRIINIVVTFLVVTLLWVVFRSENLSVALHYYGELFSFSSASLNGELNIVSWCWLLSGFIIVWAMPNTIRWFRYEHDSIERGAVKLRWYHGAMSGVLLLTALKVMSGGAAQSFVYFVF